MRIAVLGSQRGTAMLDLIALLKAGQTRATIDVVISNKQHAMILERAHHHQIDAVFVDPKGLTRKEYDEKISTICQQRQIDLIVLIGYMRILSEEFVDQWQNKVINVHPSLLPAHAGKMDLAVHQSVIDARESETGCSVHYVTKEIDAGPVLLQLRCDVTANDSAESLKSRVQQLEAQALYQTISQLCNAQQ